jgi:crotonobetainyl-CoA:carnitine CoA-transferase CaiB-like acyl-CoA transferase
VFVEVEHPTLGKQRVMRAPWRFSDWKCSDLRPGPLMGADNADVLQGLDGIPPVGPERQSEVFR